MKKMLTVAALAMCAGLVQGANYALNWRTDTGTSPTNALEWFDTAT